MNYLTGFWACKKLKKIENTTVKKNSTAKFVMDLSFYIKELTFYIKLLTAFFTISACR